MNKTPKISKWLLTVLLLAFAGTALLHWGGCKDDPCDGITCKNGGSCVNGLCQCPAGFEGHDCGIEKEPNYIQIAKITYTKIPLTHNDGTTWDDGPLPSSNPGLKVIVYTDFDPDPNVVDWHPIWDSQTDLGTFVNADPNQQQVFVPSMPITLGNPGQNYRISLYDVDGPDDELMGGITFVPYTPGQSHPEMIIQESSRVRFELNAIYQF